MSIGARLLVILTAEILTVQVFVACYLLVVQAHDFGLSFVDPRLVICLLVPLLTLGLMVDFDSRYRALGLISVLVLTAGSFYWLGLAVWLIAGIMITLGLSGILACLEDLGNPVLRWIGRHYTEGLGVLWLLFAIWVYVFGNIDYEVVW